jgi:fluoride ion exporter CrcB/FEX
VASYFWIAIGSALGGMARYWCSGVAARLIGETFPWGTIIVNIVGSFIIGFFATLTGPDGRIFADTLTRQFVMIGCAADTPPSPPSACRRLPWCRTANGCSRPPTSHCR